MLEKKKVKYQSKKLFNTKYLIPTVLPSIKCFLAVFLRVNIFDHYIINNQHLLHEVLTVKDDKDQHFTYRLSKVGLHANIPQYNK